MTDPRLQDYCWEDIWREQMEDVVEAHAREHECEVEDVSYSDIFPEDEQGSPTSKEAMLEKELADMKEDEDVETVYQRVTERWAMLELQRKG